MGWAPGFKLRRARRKLATKFFGLNDYLFESGIMHLHRVVTSGGLRDQGRQMLVPFCYTEKL